MGDELVGVAYTRLFSLVNITAKIVHTVGEMRIEGGLHKPGCECDHKLST